MLLHFARGAIKYRRLGTAVRQLSVLAAELGLSMPQLELAWILRRPEISSVITAVTRAEHVLSHALAFGVHLTPDALEHIGKILESVSNHESTGQLVVDAVVMVRGQLLLERY